MCWKYIAVRMTNDFLLSAWTKSLYNCWQQMRAKDVVRRMVLSSKIVNTFAMVLVVYSFLQSLLQDFAMLTH